MLREAAFLLFLEGTVLTSRLSHLGSGSHKQCRRRKMSGKGRTLVPAVTKYHTLVFEFDVH